VTSILLTIDPEKVALLPADERAAIVRLLDQEELLSSPAAFAARASHGMWKPYRHLRYTSDRIVAMIERDTCDLLIVEQPVRHGKSELCSRWTPAWYILRYGGRVGLASYEADFAATHGRRAREIVADAGPALGVEIDNTSKAAARWDVLGGHGGMWCAGAGGPITGKGGDLLIVDDPIKNSEAANSEVERNNLWEWWTTTFLTRRDSVQTKVIVIMSRWHSDDLVARLMAHRSTMRIERVRLPALAEDDDILGRRVGEALCPERFDEKALLGWREQVGPSAWAALYQQRPILAGGGMFKRSSFRYYTSVTGEEHTFHKLGDHLVDDTDCWRFVTMDPAYTARRRSDYTAAAVWAVTPTDPPNLMLLDMRRVRVEAVDHAPLIEDVWATWNPSWVGIEKQNAMLSLFAEAQRRGVVVRWLHPDKNKIARAETVAALMEAGRVWFPQNAPWLGEYEDEMLTFPVGAHDDQVDVTAYAGIELAAGTLRARKHKREPETMEDRIWAHVEKRNKRRHLHPTIGRF
jgi:predicted phage terminase large subunit-like protein